MHTKPETGFAINRITELERGWEKTLITQTAARVSVSTTFGCSGETKGMTAADVNEMTQRRHFRENGRTDYNSSCFFPF
jgi:hypothetical protein